MVLNQGWLTDWLKLRAYWNTLSNSNQSISKKKASIVVACIANSSHFTDYLVERQIFIIPQERFQERWVVDVFSVNVDIRPSTGWLTGSIRQRVNIVISYHIYHIYHRSRKPCTHRIHRCNVQRVFIYVSRRRAPTH